MQKMYSDCGMTSWILEVLWYFRNKFNEVINAPNGALGGLAGSDHLMEMLNNMVRISSDIINFYI